ncbi:MAG: HIT domain-containing protein [Rhizobiales bacterium]|nr:HIT domain-containing protein [Hyphomicrobiales bacterium]MBO6699241.1 HIT domain-containing protein [Hyphomicrobiales bacterium]MBO6736779.1 HIT domain-containing protein [Hyphomicrobiales bacterium]MBO6912147.1 HIT domain-containing protein [Hyphomicrobiales bacterium]MBO6956981.1 HIT domain-containing protein [Hyphomicrobiales bacterium]
MNDFYLDERLAADSLPLCQTEMSLLRVSCDARFPWLILIPQRAGLADLVDLVSDDETRVMADVRAASLALRQTTGCDKLNVASLGNMVRQLHVHIIARFESDAAWPGPIWGAGEAQPLTDLPDWALDVRSQLGWSA